MIKPIERAETLDEQYSDIWSRHGDGPAPSPAEFLANYPDASPDERHDVLLADQLVRWRRDCPKPIGDYVAEYPALISDSEMILKLVQGEFLARLERDEAPEPGLLHGDVPPPGRGDPSPVRGRPMADHPIPTGPVARHDRGPPWYPGRPRR